MQSYLPTKYNREMKKNDFILTFPKKGHLGITNNYIGIILTAIIARVHNALLLTV